ncbi:hypothetical protein ACFWIW_10670 [Amycolatopsis sp. NPDC058340]|uniref:hypothetical protein n=1 Tax=Amycolatopsis sp. NPDC058340 TaxID=3346453 RepID=UPI00365E26D6
MTLGFESIQDDLISHAGRLGVFDTVNGHETTNAPGRGVHAEVYVDTIDPVQSSGLAATSARLGVKVRVSTDMSDPQDGIDPRIVGAADAFIGSIHSDFELDGDARHVDLLGAHGIPLSGRSGYMVRANQQFRVIDVIVPIIINDAWTQEA